MRRTEIAEKWIARLIWLLIAEPSVKLDVVFRLEDAPEQQSRPSALFDLVQKASLRRYAPFEPIALGVKPSCCFVDLRFDRTAGGLTPETQEKVRKRQLDVLLWLDSQPLWGACSGLARFGVWSFRLTELEKPLRQPPYWAEIVDETQISAIALLRHVERFEKAQVMAQHLAPTEPGWLFTQLAEQMTWMAGPLLLRGLLDAMTTSTHSSTTAPQAIELPASIQRFPSSLEIARFLSARTRHSIAVRTTRSAGQHRRWFTAIRKKRQQNAGAGDRREFREIPKPPGSEYADPFLLERDGRHWLFFEEVPPGASRGRLAVSEIQPDGSLGERMVILQKPYHLSYPAVFQYGDDVFFVPESAEHKVVELYRAAEFPFRWELHTTPIDGLALVDTTPFFHEGTWFFFTTTKAPIVETFLFYSDRPDGSWSYHPSNPICSDVRRARGAGALFYRDGKLIRPSQDSSGSYGGAIVLNEITSLSKEYYTEHPLERIEPDWQPGLLGTHTISSDSLFEVIDGVRWER